MIEIVWEITVREEAQGFFELAFGPGGAWSKVFARCPGFRGATLLRHHENSCHYLLFDIWDTAAHREQALVEHSVEFAELETALAGWIASRRELGAFRMLAETTVRPRGAARQGKSREARRRDRRPPR